MAGGRLFTTLGDLVALTQPGLDWVITPDRLSQAMGQLSLNKSPGPDNITPAMLRNGWDLILPLFTKICQGCLNFGTIPLGWRRDRMVFIPKTG